ncbi:hypothetical protein FHS85_001636 [Rhodoligotrophos appendicifer]|uniref:hypothetical protein n=1 Tax=Rhodoligotrophos appendicifer TaxID=987056 RepID=UPI0011848601|nr:hypothetical protein [Rhodoligotrophos appendicifer]
MLTMCAGCARSNDASTLAALPPPPAFLAAIPLPAVRNGMDARLALGQNRAAAAEANARLKASRQWYDGVRSEHGSGVGKGG